MLDLNQFTGFTPGPWHISADNNDVENVNDAGVCALYADESSQANAKLIAAAPELLTECKRLRADLDAAMAFIRDNSKSPIRRNAILMAMDYLYPKPPTAPPPAPPDRQ